MNYDDFKFSFSYVKPLSTLAVFHDREIETLRVVSNDPLDVRL